MRGINSDLWIEIPSGIEHCKCFQKEVGDGHLNVLIGREPDARGRMWLHMSIAHRTSEPEPKPGRPVTNRELKDARYTLVIDNCLMCEMWPPKEMLRASTYPTARHLWEIPLEFAY